MKWPWRKLEDKMAKAIVNLKMIMEKRIDKAIEIEHAMVMSQLNLFKTSEQIKHTRLTQRIQLLEGCCAKELEQYHKDLNDREIDAAKELDK